MQANNDSSNTIYVPYDAEALCALLKTLVEEWGPNSVHVRVPAHWKGYTTMSLGRLRLEFDTKKTIEIHVDYEDIHLNYTAKVDTSLAI